MIGFFFPSPLNTKPVKNEQELLRDCSKFCEAAYLPLDKDTGALEKYGIEETYYNWERRSNRAITFTTKLNLSSLYSTENETFTEERVPVTVVAFRGTSNLSEILEDLKSYKAVQLYSESLREIVSTTVSAIFIGILFESSLYFGFTLDIGHSGSQKSGIIRYNYNKHEHLEYNCYFSTYIVVYLVFTFSLLNNLLVIIGIPILVHLVIYNV